MTKTSTRRRMTIVHSERRLVVLVFSSVSSPHSSFSFAPSIATLSVVHPPNRRTCPRAIRHGWATMVAGPNRPASPSATAGRCGRHVPGRPPCRSASATWPIAGRRAALAHATTRPRSGRSPFRLWRATAALCAAQTPLASPGQTAGTSHALQTVAPPLVRGPPPPVPQSVLPPAPQSTPAIPVASPAQNTWAADVRCHGSTHTTSFSIRQSSIIGHCRFGISPNAQAR